jgi:hypothetical protein
MILPGYGEEENEFYARAVVNYPDHNPVREVVVSGCGPVTVKRSDGKVIKTVAPYTLKELSAVIEQGSRRARPLTHDETETAKKNRTAARGDLASMETWQRGEMRESTKGKRLQRARGGPEDQTLRGVELGDTFWNPVEW